MVKAEPWEGGCAVYRRPQTEPSGILTVQHWFSSIQFLLSRNSWVWPQIDMMQNDDFRKTWTIVFERFARFVLHMGPRFPRIFVLNRIIYRYVLCIERSPRKKSTETKVRCNTELRGGRNQFGNFKHLIVYIWYDYFTKRVQFPNTRQPASQPAARKLNGFLDSTQ
jgi:hypothetical protein